MRLSDLELCTTKELIAELMRRPTFLGVVVQSEEEYRNEVWGDERIFKVHFNENLGDEQAARLLEAVVARMDGEAS